MPKQLYLKGYKLDNEKIRRRFPREANEAKDSYEFTWYQPIFECIPTTAYQYVGYGIDLDGHLIAVIVLDDGYDEAALKGSSVETNDPTLSGMAQSILTSGVWPAD